MQTYCANCKKSINVFPSRLKRTKFNFCDHDCHTSFRKNKSKYDLSKPSRVKIIKCTFCKKQFKRKISHIKEVNFCSNLCRHSASRGIKSKRNIQITVKCFQCGKQISKPPSRIRTSQTHFCSQECKSKYQINPKIHIKLKCNYCEKEYQTTTHQLIKRNSKYCSKICQDSDKRTRETAYAFHWRKIAAKIRKRDNYTCQNCGIIQKRPSLDVHHIIPAYKFEDDYKSANSPNNLITLCRSCHRQIESKIK